MSDEISPEKDYQVWKISERSSYSYEEFDTLEEAVKTVKERIKLIRMSKEGIKNE